MHATLLCIDVRMGGRGTMSLTGNKKEGMVRIQDFQEGDYR